MTARELIEWAASAPIPASIAKELVEKLGYLVPIEVPDVTFAGKVIPNTGLCPRCGTILDSEIGSYCPNCGQALLWDEGEEHEQSR